MTCPNCQDVGWVYVEHPLKPGVPMCMTPCPKCNFDGHIPMPEPPLVTYEIAGELSASLWQEGTTCPYCMKAVLVRVEPNGMRCEACGYEISWTP